MDATAFQRFFATDLPAGRQVTQITQIFTDFFATDYTDFHGFFLPQISQIFTDFLSVFIRFIRVPKN